MQYDNLVPEDIHSDWLSEIPTRPGQALDIGAGSGRDARWLTRMGWQVTAIEPCTELREIAEENSSERITWIRDALPHLRSVTGHSYDLILVSAVWMHLTQTKQKQAYHRLLTLLSQKGLLVITWRNQGNDNERLFEAVDDTVFKNANIISSSDKGGRSELIWKCALIKNTT